MTTQRSCMPGSSQLPGVRSTAAVTTSQSLNQLPNASSGKRLAARETDAKHRMPCFVHVAYAASLLSETGRCDVSKRASPPGQQIGS